MVQDDPAAAFTTNETCGLLVEGEAPAVRRQQSPLAEIREDRWADVPGRAEAKRERGPAPIVIVVGLLQRTLPDGNQGGRTVCVDGQALPHDVQREGDEVGFPRHGTDSLKGCGFGTLVVELVLRGVYSGQHVALCPLQLLLVPPSHEQALIADLQAPALGDGEACSCLERHRKLLVVEEVLAIDEGAMPGVGLVLGPELVLGVLVVEVVDVEAPVRDLQNVVRPRKGGGKEALGVPTDRPWQLAGRGPDAGLLSSVELRVHRPHPRLGNAVERRLVVHLHVLQLPHPFLDPLTQSLSVGGQRRSSKRDLLHGVDEAAEDVRFLAAGGDDVRPRDQVRAQDHHEVGAGGHQLRCGEALLPVEAKLERALFRSEEEQYHQPVLGERAVPIGSFYLSHLLNLLLGLGRLVDHSDASGASFHAEGGHVLYQPEAELRHELVHLRHRNAVPLGGADQLGAGDGELGDACGALPAQEPVGYADLAHRGRRQEAANPEALLDLGEHPRGQRPTCRGIYRAETLQCDILDHLRQIIRVPEGHVHAAPPRPPRRTAGGDG
mmetsp:Transcript_19393/g.58391  ORF Transcript_19393/g.58391 Transcript_19393/m.58391 type:complete len:552 (+) Transcript_19393:1661-3316(+)